MKKRILSLFLAFVMAVGLVPMSALATGDHAVTVGFTVVDCLDGKIEYMRKELTVEPGLAKQHLGGEYGESVGLNITVPEDAVTPVDVLVAAHIDAYGADFEENPDTYIAGFDYAQKMFGVASEITWTANGIMPYNEEYIGYAINQYIVQEDDEICFYRMNYMAYPANVYASFDQVEAEVDVGEELTLNLGFCATMEYGEEKHPAADTEIYFLNENGTMGSKTGWRTDNAGNVTLCFDIPGVYYLTCMGQVSYNDAMMGMNSVGTLSPAHCKVTVKEAAPPVVDVTEVTLDKETLSLEVGGSDTLSATVKPDDATDKTVSWTSSNEEVATVDNTGKVTAVAAGEATITAKAGEQEDTCAVAVTAPAPVGTDPTVVFNNSQNGTWGGMGYVTKATIKSVSVTGYEWSGDTCNITLAAGTSATAPVTLEFNIGFKSNQPPVIQTFGISLNGSKCTITSQTVRSGIIALNGAETSVQAVISGNGSSGTKTFVFTIPNPNHVPVLKDSSKSNESATVTVDTAYQVDLGSLFADEDSDVLSYKVSMDAAAPVDASVENGIYTYNCPDEGDHTLVFTAVDSKGGESTDTYTVSLKVTPKNTSENNYTTNISLPEGVTAQFYTLGGEEGSPEPGTALEAAAKDSTYSVEVPEDVDTLYIDFTDRYLVTKAKADGSLTLREVEVSAQDIFGTAVDGTVTVTDSDGCKASAKGSSYYLAEGKTYTAAFAPASTTTHKAATTEQEITSSTAQITVPVDYNNQKIIVTPKGAKAQLFRYEQYYKNTEFLCRGETENQDGTVSHYFAGVIVPPPGGSTIYRVTYEDYIVKAGWSDAKATVTVTYSENDLKNDTRVDYTKSSEAYAGFAEDGVLLNVNGRNHQTMSVNESKTLKAYRAWEIIPVSYNNYIIEPDFHFNVVWESQEDVISLADKANPMTGGESWQTLTANQPGTAILEVTYDAIQVSGGSYDGAYGASDPARTGLVVVTVGGTTPDVNFGIHGKASQGSTTFSESNAKAWDAEFDTLYFTGDQGELTFTPASGSGITEVAVSNDKGASWTTLTAEDGTYTAKIISGNNILRVTTETGTAYQVVRGDKISTRLVNVTNPGQPFAAGDTVRVILDGLHTPIPKMAGNYNPGAKDSFAGGAGSLIQLNYTFCGSPVQGTGRQYDFITSGNAVEVTIPESEDGTVVSLQDGYIGLGVIGLTNFADGGDSHRNIPDGGCVTRDSKATAHTRSVLPDITIEVGGLPTGNTAPYIRDNAAETATITQGKTYAVNLTTIFGDREGDTLTYKLAAGEEAAVIDSYYTFTPEAAGSYTLTFIANDGQLDSKPHTVTLTVKEAPAEEPDGPTAPDFGLSKDEIDGYVTVSFEDKGVRVAGDEGTYPKALGTILKKTRVPYTQGDTIADVTLRALDAYDFTYSHTGTTKSGFYLSSIGSFTVNGIDYDSFGEFDAGIGSGWMITWDDVFINKGASEFQVENGDVIRWQYTCQLGADIGDDGSAMGGGNQAPQVPPEVLPEEPPVTSSPYTDVTGHWAEKAISVVHEKGLMTGTKEDAFSPETELSRAMLVTILYRMAGEPAVTADNTFSDVTDGTWYTNAVIWASQNGIVNGVGKDLFAPNNDITREQMAAMLLRYSDYKGYDTTQKNDLADYTDADQISTWALAALQWANGEGLITGRKADLLVPQGDTTRAETATILMRYLETIA